MASLIPRLDARIVRAAQDHHAAVPDAVARTLSDLTLVYVLFGVIAIAVCLHGRSARPALTGLAAVLVAGAITYALKVVVDRPRPPLSQPLIHPLVSLPADASMPSGHASFSMAAAVALGAFSRRLLPILLALAVLIALSRVWAGVHYPTDVLLRCDARRRRRRGVRADRRAAPLPEGGDRPTPTALVDAGPRGLEAEA